MSDREERMEQFAHSYPGPKGERGPRGKEGKLPAATRRAIIYLFIVSFLLAGAALVLSIRQVSKSDHQWCATLDLLYPEKPPAGNAAANPSRAYLQDLHARFADLRSSLGCA